MRSSLFRLLTAIILATGIVGPAFAQSQNQNQAIDPPARVGRLSFTSGPVSLQAPGDTDWSTAPVNYPVSNGTNLWVDPAGPAEIEIGPDRITLGGGTELDVTSLDDAVMGFNLPQGSMLIRLGALNRGEQVQIGTPRGLVQLTKVGRYRIDAGNDNEPTRITVLEGEAQLIEDSSSPAIRAGQAAVLPGGDQVSVSMERASPSDLDRFAEGREPKRRVTTASAPPVSPQMTGVAELSQYGQWEAEPSYGQVWYPADVPQDWAPYSYGHWAWISPWGWTWIDDAPWGFAPFHYGRWVHASRGWGWYPGPAVARPVFAPALVVFLGTPTRYSAGVRGPGVAWAPLAPREAYVPPFRTSAQFRVQINLGQTRSVVAPRAPRNVQFAVEQSHARQPIFRPAEAPRQAPRVAASAPVSPRVERLHQAHPQGERITPTAATTTGAPVRPGFDGRDRDRNGAINAVARPPEAQQRFQERARQEQQRQASPTNAQDRDRDRDNRNPQDRDRRNQRDGTPVPAVAPAGQAVPGATPQDRERNRDAQQRGRDQRDQQQRAATPTVAPSGQPAPVATPNDRTRDDRERGNRNAQDRAQREQQQRAAAPSTVAPSGQPAPVVTPQQQQRAAVPPTAAPAGQPAPVATPPGRDRDNRNDQERAQRFQREQQQRAAAPSAAAPAGQPAPVATPPGRDRDNRNDQERAQRFQREQQQRAAPAAQPAPVATPQDTLRTAAPRPPAQPAPQAPTPAVAPPRPPVQEQHREPPRAAPPQQVAPAAVPRPAPQAVPQAPPPQPAATRPPPPPAPAAQPPRPAPAPAAAPPQQPHPPAAPAQPAKEQPKDKKEGG